jgi:hypothetical protein
VRPASTRPPSTPNARQGGRAAGTGPAGAAAARPGRRAGSSGWEDFTEQLSRQGVLLRPRMSEKTPGQITGYAVALPGRSDSGQAIWFGGGKLAPDLTLPQLQRRWAATNTRSPGRGWDASARRPARAHGRRGRAAAGDGPVRADTAGAATAVAGGAGRRDPGGGADQRHGGAAPTRGWRGTRRGRRRTCSPSSRSSPNDGPAARTPTPPARSSTPGRSQHHTRPCDAERTAAAHRHHRPVRGPRRAAVGDTAAAAAHAAAQQTRRRGRRPGPPRVNGATDRGPRWWPAKVSHLARVVSGSWGGLLTGRGPRACGSSRRRWRRCCCGAGAGRAG